MAPMAFKHFTPNFERARTFTFVNVHILDVRERAPPATPTFGCARRNGKRPTVLLLEMDCGVYEAGACRWKRGRSSPFCCWGWSAASKATVTINVSRVTNGCSIHFKWTAASKEWTSETTADVHLASIDWTAASIFRFDIRSSSS